MRQTFKGRIRASAIALVLAAAAAGQPARAVDAACKPVLDATAKQMTTPSHLYMTQIAAFRGGKPVSGESIYTGGALYFQVRGKWRRSPVSPEEMLKQRQDNVRKAKSMTCRYLRDETVNGESAAVYRTQSETEDAKSDSTLWISKRTGLPLKSETDLDVGGKQGKEHSTTRFDYTDVHPPAGVR